MAANGDNAGFEVIISSDSHVMEPSEILVERVPKTFKDQAPRFPQLKLGESFQTHPGGSDPTHRITEMETDLSPAALRDGRRQAAGHLFPRLQRLAN
jgi:hypothetical protein